MSVENCAHRQALQDLLATYAAAVDERDRERYFHCFTDDVEVVGFGDQTHFGRSNWVEYVWTALGNYDSTQHLLGSQLATVDGKRASARTDVQALHVLAGSEEKFTLWATYLSDMILTEHGWKICRHELVVRASQSH